MKATHTLVGNQTSKFPEHLYDADVSEQSLKEQANMMVYKRHSFDIHLLTLRQGFKALVMVIVVFLLYVIEQCSGKNCAFLSYGPEIFLISVK